MGEAGLCLPIRVPVNSAQAVRGSVGWQVLGGEGKQTTLCPTGTDLPAIGFPREPQPPATTTPLPSLVLLLNPWPALSLPWRPWAHQLGHPHPAPTALAPALAAQ